MSAQAKPTEPSMEEILASIRRIISDDDVKPADGEAVAATDAEAPAEAAAAPAPESAPATAAAADEDVLDLGAEAALVAAPAAEPAAATPAPAPMAEEPDVAFVDPPPSPAPAAEPPPAAVFAPPSPPPAPLPSMGAGPVVDMASLLSDQASSVVTNAFGHLANTVLSNNARTLEDLVKEMLKPMLKAWLDDNLPTMVERLVRTEIERVARGGRN